jgi:hypothetical protein
MTGNRQVRCAVRRVIMTRTQSGNTRRRCLGYQLTPAIERSMGQEHVGRKAPLREDAVEQVAFDPADMVKA